MGPARCLCTGENAVALYAKRFMAAGDRGCHQLTVTDTGSTQVEGCGMTSGDLSGEQDWHPWCGLHGGDDAVVSWVWALGFEVWVSECVWRS